MSSVAEEALRKIEEAKAKAAADALAAEEAAKKAKTAELEKFWKAVSDYISECPAENVRRLVNCAVFPGEGGPGRLHWVDLSATACGQQE